MIAWPLPSMGHRGRDRMVVKLSMRLPSMGHRGRGLMVVELSMFTTKYEVCEEIETLLNR